MRAVSIGGMLLAAWGAAANEVPVDPERALGIVRQRYTEALLAAPVPTSSVRSLLRAQQDDGSWPDLDYTDLSRTGFRHQQHADRIWTLARAYRKPGTEFHGDAGCRDAIVRALGFWLTHDFRSANWWHNEIGVPRRMADVLLLVDRDLPPEARAGVLAIARRANLQGFGARPGGDLVVIAEIMAKTALVERDAATVERATLAIVDELRITTERGIQPDYSFHHRNDNVLTVGYAQGYAAAVASYAQRMAGTPFALPEDRLRLVIDLELDGLRWTMAHGRYRQPGAMNRELTRKGGHGPVDASSLEQLAAVTTYRNEELRALALVRRRPDLPAPHGGNRYFWHSTFMAHQRPTYYSSVRMYASRNHSTEGTFNGEGLLNHHLADGSHFILRTGREYDGIAPVWDWQMIPGTTVVRTPSLVGPVQVRGRRDFVGGVSDGHYGLAVFDFESARTPLTARKAWFFFDDEIVALGAGIGSSAEHPVLTTVNQCRLHGEVTVGRDDRSAVLPRGTESGAASWIHHDGIGYVFPEPATLHVFQGEMEGDWRRANHQYRTEPVTAEVFALWLDHGHKPGDARYAYIVTPGLDANGMDGYTRRMPVRILANEAALQAVYHRELGITMVAFHEPGRLTVGPGLELSAGAPCLVLVRVEQGTPQYLVVSDPTQKRGTLTLELSARLEAEQALWNEDKGTSSLTIDLPSGGLAGQSVRIDARNPAGP